jgi:paraquat-inducible protein B
VSPAEIPELEDNRTFNLLTSIWIVPLVALIISAGLIYKHYSELGSEIRIDFPSSDGLVPEQSVVKFRDVAIGKITRIELQKDGDGVTVVARMNKESEPYLNRSTHFWIVRPQVDYNGIRGLDTLIHGAYISMYAPKKGKLKTHFKGLDKPFRAKEEGQIIHLRTSKLGNIHVGAPVYYRSMQAGSIEEIVLSADHIHVDVSVFIKKKYAQFINPTTKFWHQDLLDINIENGRIGLDMAPLTSVLLGSINFESKFDKHYSPLGPGHVFELYDRYADTMRETIGHRNRSPMRFRFVFEGRVKGLHEGLKIRYQGFDVGELDDVLIKYDSKSRSMKAEAFGVVGSSVFGDGDHNGTYNLKQAIMHGLVAQLESSNPLFGELYIGLEYPAKEDNTTHKIVSRNGIIDFPTKKNIGNESLSKLESILDSLADIATDTKKPLKDLLINLDKSARHLNEFMSKKSFMELTDELNQTMGGINSFTADSSELGKAIKELRKTLKTTKNVMKGYGSGSLFGKKLEAMLKEVGKTSEETKRLIQKLNKKPNSLIFGD